MLRLDWRLLLSLGACTLANCVTYSGLDSSSMGGSSSSAGASAGSSSTAGTGNQPDEAGAGAAAEIVAASGSGGTAVDMGGTSGSGGNSGSANGGMASGGTSGSANGGSAGSSGSGGAMQGTVVPNGLSLASKVDNVQWEPDPGGSTYAERCPAGQVVIGYNGTVDVAGGPTYLRSAQAICGKIALSAKPPWKVLVTEAMPLPVHGQEFSVKQTAKCPANEVMTSFAGRSGLWMDSVDVRCAPLSILGTSPDFVIVIGSSTKAGTIGGPTGGSPFDPLECPMDEVSVGQIGSTVYSGDVLGAFGMECAKITLQTSTM